MTIWLLRRGAQLDLLAAAKGERHMLGAIRDRVFDVHRSRPIVADHEAVFAERSEREMRDVRDRSSSHFRDLGAKSHAGGSSGNEHRQHHRGFRLHDLHRAFLHGWYGARLARDANADGPVKQTRSGRRTPT